MSSPNAEIRTLEADLEKSRRDLREAAAQMGHKAASVREYLELESWARSHPIIIPALGALVGFAIGFRKNSSREGFIAMGTRAFLLSGAAWLFWKSVRR